MIAENYRSVQILTEDGEVFTGQITRGVDYRSPVLRLATDANPSQIVEIEKSRMAVASSHRYRGCLMAYLTLSRVSRSLT